MKKKILFILSLFISTISFTQTLNDELYHFVGGVTIGGSATFNYHKPSPNLNYGYIIKKSLIAGSTISLLKETYDVSRYGINKFNTTNVVSLSLGTVVGSVIAYTIKKNIRKKPKYKNCPQF